MKYLDLGTYKFVKQPNQYTKWYQRIWAKIVWYTKVVIRLTTICGVTGAVIYVAFLAGKMSRPVHVTAQVIETKEDKAAIMQRIAGCESEGNRNSKGSHVDKNGNVRVTHNSNGTDDVGINQINTIWFITAMKMNLNLMVEKDNQAFADYLYANYGTEPWYSSKACWK